MPLRSTKPIDMSVDRGRILPLGGRSQSSDGFRLTEKVVDRPNPYNRFSRKDRIQCSARNDSNLTPRSGAMSAQGEIEYRGGKRPTSLGDGNSFQNDISACTPSRKTGKFMTGVEDKMIRDRIWAEDHPRKLTKHVDAPERPALDNQGRSPFITANGMIAKFQDVSPNKAQKNKATPQEDLDTRSQARMRAMSSGATPQRYRSPFRDAAMNREKSPLNPNSLPLHPEIDKSGLAKAQKFGASRRQNESSLTGVFMSAPQKAPPPYKLVAPFYTSD